MRCVDCGERDIKTITSSRRDVCDKCFGNRIILMSALQEAKISMPDFQDIQKHKYRRKNKMILLKLISE